MKRVLSLALTVESWWPAAALIGCFSFAAWGVTVGWNNSITDSHGFRQTQTAITAYYAAQSFPALSYETPVLGYPWAIPFELPVYQWIVGALVAMLGTPLDQTARFVAVMFFALTALPANLFLKTLSVSSRCRCIFLALFFITPFYIYWSRACLIESTALFFSVSYLAYASKCLKDSTASSAAIAILAGALAGGVKATTLLPFVLIVGILSVSASVSAYVKGQFFPWLRQVAPKCSLLLGLPMLAAIAWTRYTDAIKSANALTDSLTSANMIGWNFGTVAQRLTWTTWTTIFGQTQRCLGSYYVAVIVLAVFCACLARRRMKESLCCLGMYAAAPFVFTNLYLVHEYYQYASMLFIATCLGFVITGLIECGGLRRQLAPVLVLVIVVSSTTYYFAEFLERQNLDNRGCDTIASCIRSVTSPDEVVVVVGCDWSSEIPYYCQRRSLMFPDYDGFLKCSRCIHEYDVLLQNGFKIGAIVVGAESHLLSQSQLRDLVMRAGLDLKPSTVPGFRVYHRLLDPKEG